MAQCRCGAGASRKCGACGCELNAAGICTRHPAADASLVRCLHCGRALCSWHYALQPTTGHDGRPTLGQVCFPGCAHGFDVPEWRPGDEPRPGSSSSLGARSR